MIVIGSYESALPIARLPTHTHKLYNPQNRVERERGEREKENLPLLS